MHINKILTICLLLLTTAAYAQPKGYQPVKDISAFQNSLASANSKINTIKSDFSQVKEMSLLAEKINSNGKFYFQKEDKVRIQYTEPYDYLLIMNGTRLLVKDEHSTNKINTRNSKMMQSVNRVMVDCMQGTVFNNPDFSVKAYSNTSTYLLQMTPVDVTMKQLFDQVEVYMAKDSYDVEKLIMQESGGDYTIMKFTNIKHNTALNEGLFKAK